MTDRKYSVAEIDQMRRDVRELNGGHYGSHAVAEEMLRTYMLNGTDPEDLRAAAGVVRANTARIIAIRDAITPHAGTP